MQNQKGIASVILVVAIVVLVAVAGFFAYQYFSPKTQPVVQTQQNQNQQQQTANQQTNNVQPIDQIAGWKTYTNAQYGFEFQYPKEWVTSDNSAATVSVWSSEKKKQEAVNAIIPIYPEFSVNYKGITSFNDFAKGLLGKSVSGVKEFLQLYNPNFTEINIDGKKAYATVFVSSVADYLIYIESDNGVYVLSTPYIETGISGYDSKNPNINPIAKQIISTFKFTK
jgi:hypothetical protein